MKRSSILCALFFVFFLPSCGRGSGSAARKPSVLDNARIQVLRDTNFSIVKSGIKGKVFVPKNLYNVVAAGRSQYGCLLLIDSPEDKIWIVEEKDTALLSGSGDIFHKRLLGVKRDGTVVAASFQQFERDLAMDQAKYIILEPAIK